MDARKGYFNAFSSRGCACSRRAFWCIFKHRVWMLEVCTSVGFRGDIRANVVRFLAEGMDAVGEYFGAFLSRGCGCSRCALRCVFELIFGQI